MQLSKSPRNNQSAFVVTSNVALAPLGPEGLAVADRPTLAATVLNFVLVENVIEPAVKARKRGEQQKPMALGTPVDNLFNCTA